MKKAKKAMKKDRISDLPRPILHHILYHLSQNDAVKTCVLSKSWRHLWYGRPNIEFCKDDFKGLTVKKFISVLHKTLIRYEKQNLSIQQFILKIPETTNDSRSAPFLKKWIPKIVMRNIKCIETFQLCFHIMDRSEYYFELPSVIYLSESLREIYLEGCKLNQINSSSGKVLFRHLQTLRLCRVKVEEETFERIMSSCPLIEEVSLNKCEGLNTIRVNNHNCSLKYFEYRSCHTWDYVSRFETNSIFFHLKSLHLSGVHLTKNTKDSFSCNFPCLEELELINCYGDFEEFQLSSLSITRLSIEADENPIKISIDAPNILKFEYQGFDFPQQISFTTTSNKWKSKIGLTILYSYYIDYIPQWLHKLDELLKVFGRSETSLHILVDVDFDNYRAGGHEYLIEAIVKHLELCLGNLCSDYSVWCEEEASTKRKRLIQSSH